MNKKKFTKLLALYLPYLVIGLAATNLGEAWRLAEGKELGDKIVSLMGTLPAAFANPLPSLHPLDILVGICCGAGLRLAVYLKSKNAKKYRHGMEYGSARWGTPADIAPFMAPKFEDNIILTKTERLMMSNRPPDPKNARNKNVLVVGGSGSGKTRYFIKPNLLQCTSKSHPVSFVVTDPKGGLIQECGLALLKNGYKIRTMNTINFHKSMRYNPFAYIHEEKDILKLVTTLMTNTKGEGQGGDPFWDKAERLLLTSLIAYLHYEAPAEEQNFATLLEMLNTMQVSEEDEDYQNPVDLLFEDLAKKKPNSFAGRVIADSHVLCHRKDECRFSHSGTGGDNDEVGILPTGSNFVDVVKPGLQSAQSVTSIGCYLNLSDSFAQYWVYLSNVFFQVTLGNFKEFPLGFLHKVIYVVGLVKGLVEYFAGKFD